MHTTPVTLGLDPKAAELYQHISDLVGCAEGPEDLSENYKAYLPKFVN